jgi:hypothetical protein
MPKFRKCRNNKSKSWFSLSRVWYFLSCSLETFLLGASSHLLTRSWEIRRRGVTLLLGCADVASCWELMLVFPQLLLLDRFSVSFARSFVHFGYPRPYAFLLFQSSFRAIFKLVRNINYRYLQGTYIPGNWPMAYVQKHWRNTCSGLGSRLVTISHGT